MKKLPQIHSTIPVISQFQFPILGTGIVNRQNDYSDEIMI